MKVLHEDNKFYLNLLSAFPFCIYSCVFLWARCCFIYAGLFSSSPSTLLIVCLIIRPCSLSLSLMKIFSCPFCTTVSIVAAFCFRLARPSFVPGLNFIVARIPMVRIRFSQSILVWGGYVEHFGSFVIFSMSRIDLLMPLMMIFECIDLHFMQFSCALALLSWVCFDHVHYSVSSVSLNQC